MNTKSDNPMRSVVAYGIAILAEMNRTWQGRADHEIDWDRLAELSSSRFCEFARYMSWQVIQIGGKPEYYEEGSRVLTTFVNLTGEMLASAAGGQVRAIERLRRARAECVDRGEWFEKQKHQSKAYFDRVNEITNNLFISWNPHLLFWWAKYRRAINE